ncbi:hypothetical protein T440DRAFT_384380 [Plenodomus tracheiphilus IPT5]|uniref:Fungal N-terminal domain-containing protein n=1 Tax=Plenodomus tracheiphilus IPT5 TaxID=1408161 RepID=A0A6A7BLP0_9PLEO|nr:hypothetical protein T440DRAFT_384380 [Plenodomus tracheiphilus IPT5]
MSFGVSIGDFIAVSKLIKDISDCLRTGAVKTEYQAILHILELLEKALCHLDTLRDDPSSPGRVDFVKIIRLSCRHWLKAFLDKIESYDKTFGTRSQPGFFSHTSHKLKWTSHQRELEAFKTQLIVHIGVINMELEQRNLACVEQIKSQLEVHDTHINKRLDDTRVLLENAKKTSDTQALLMDNLQSMFTLLFFFVFGELRKSLQALSQMLIQNQSGTQEVLMQLRQNASIPPVICSMDFYIVEDAVGRFTRIPSEWDFASIDAHIQHRFKAGPGSREVLRGHYEFCRVDRRSQTITTTIGLIPGMRILMIVIILTLRPTDMIYPFHGCWSEEVTPCTNGGFTW